MIFKELVKYIKNDGCKVILFDRDLIAGDKAAFSISASGPRIQVATKNYPLTKLTSTLLHEYGHYLQWKDGIAEYTDIFIDTWGVWHEWILGDIELTSREIKMIRSIMLWLEWDAEIRAYWLGQKLKVSPFNAEQHLRWAIAYMISIKWSWEERKAWVYNIPERFIKSPKILTPEELLAPLTEEEKEIIPKIR